MVRNVTRQLLMSMVAPLALGLAAASAVAQPAPTTGPGGRPKYERNQTLKVDAKLSDRTKPKTPQPSDQPKQPQVTADEFLEIQGEVGNIRQQQIDLLQNLVDSTPDSDVAEKADLYFRLADAHAQLNRYHRLKGTEARIKADSAPNAAAKKKLLAEADDHDKQALNSLKLAIKAYKDLTDNDAFKNYPDMDKALFYFAYSLSSAKYMKDARTIYHRLLTDYPQSQFVPEAYLAFADYYFGASELENAEAFYKKVLLFPKSKVYSYSNYMLGWVYLNMKQHEDAGKQFLQVIRDTTGVKKEETLNKAAKKDFVRAFAEFGQVQKAWATFQKIDPSFAEEMYEILADLYVEQGKTDRAVYAYRELIKEEPKNKNVCLWQYNIAQAMLSTAGATNQQKVDEIVLLAKLWDALKDKKVLPKDEASECHDNAAAMAGDMARAYHSESIRTKNPETLAYADKLYNIYLDTFPDADDFGETQYYYAELLWSRADAETNPREATELWENAAVAFTNVVKAGKVDDKLKKESAYAAVLGWKNALAVDPRPKDPSLKMSADDKDDKDDKIPEPQPIPEREQKMIDAFDIYIGYIKDPNDADLVGMMFLKAAMYRRFNQFDKAAPIFEDIIKNHPSHETALYSANTLLDIYIITHKYDQVGAWAQYIHDNPKFLTAKEDQDRSQLGERSEEILKIAARKILEQTEEEAKKTGSLAKYVECGNGYLKLFNDTVKANPDAGVKDKIDETLYNAGVCYENGHSLSAAISAYQELQERFPDSPQSAKALARLGGVYARVAYYKEASAEFEEYAKKYAGQDDAYKAMNDAVFYRKGIGDDDKAIENTNYFISKFGGKKQGDAANAFFSLASIYEKRGDLDQVVKHYRDYLKKYGEKGGGDKVVIAYARIGQILWDQSCPVKTVDDSCIKVARERAVGTRAKKKAAKGDVRTQCGADTKLKVTPVDRDPRKVKDALAAFDQAAKEFERKKGEFGKDADAYTARKFYAFAKFHQAEVDYEQFLRVKFPEGLNFDPKKPAELKKSNDKFQAWFKEKDRLAGKAGDEYTKLITVIKDPTNAIAAAARIGQISQTFSDALYTAEVPAFLRPYDEAVDAYCDKLTEVAEPYEAKSLEGFGACLKASTDFGWFSSWSKLCERELGQIKPEDYPTASEVRAEPDEVMHVSDVEPPITTLE
ncbi:MAG TPA: tetratricopeptide repeat protein [Kofleriaceae bacterium]|nr:tetratricopeptide repeat protein [Kofleriaceae bacterium]